MIDWVDASKNKPTDFVEVHDWTYEIDVLVYPKIEGMDDSRDAVYRINEGKFFMSQSDGYSSYNVDVTDFITHFVILSDPK